MTVRELINELNCYPDDMEVEIAYSSHDYWKTIVCKDIKDVDKGYVKYSDYHRLDKLIDIDDEDEEDNDKREVLILQ